MEHGSSWEADAQLVIKSSRLVKHNSQQKATGPYRAQSNAPNQFTENIDTVLRRTTTPNQYHPYNFATKIMYPLLVSPMSHPSNINELITLKCGDGVPSLGISRLGREVDQSPPSSSGVKNESNQNLIPPNALMMCKGTNLLLRQ
jgi:hypothetical protein